MELTGKKYGRSDWRKLMSTRRGTILVALAATIAAGAILLVAMSRYRHSVDASGNPETVFVATQVIPKGTPGEVIASQGMFKPTQILQKQVSTGAIADSAALSGKVLAREITPGEQLTTADFTTNGGLVSQLAPADRGMTVTLDQQHGMLGVVNTGDHVDVYAGIALTDASGRNTPVLRLLIPNVTVLKAGSKASGTGVTASSNDTSQVTLDIPNNEAGPLAYAADNGKVWLVLRPANAVSTAPPSTITVQSLLAASRPVSAPANSKGGHR
jgi:Flp pilus assembly protein CpaB